MRLHGNVREVSVSGEKSTSDFRIATSAKAFKILSDGIYSDKVRAIIRELSTNAYDSHVDAGKESIPFDVHLPTVSEMYFSVRDYGTGMSKEKIENLYTTYFDSDRNTSDDFTGALGLGSKSPFSYTDSFTVESHYNGEKYIYNCHISNSGQPQVALLFEDKTTEPNGVEVKFSVNQYDADEFIRKAPAIFYAFPIKPNLTGKTIDFFNRKIVDSGKDWELLRGDFNRRNGALALMGNVAYPINTSPFDSQLSESAREFLENANIDIYFKIGELDVSASRESLSYDPLTIKNIVTKAENITREFQDKIDKTASSAKNYWEAIYKLNKLMKEYQQSIPLSRVIPFTSFRGSKIALGNNFRFDTGDQCKIIHYQEGHNRIERDTRYGDIYVNFGKMPLVVVNDEDTERKCSMKARTYLKNSEYYDEVFIIQKSDWKKKYQREWKNIPVKYSTELPKPVYERKTKKATPKHFADVTNSSHIIGFRDGTELDFNVRHFYVTIKNNRFIHLTEDGDEGIDFESYREFLSTFGFLQNAKIYAVKTYEVKKKKFQENAWINIVDFVRDNIASMASQYRKQIQNYIDARENQHEISNWESFFSDDLADKIENRDSIYHQIKNVFDPIKKSLEDVYSNVDLRTKLNGLIRFSRMYNIDIPKANIDFEIYENKIKEAYPMLKIIRRSERTYPETIEYINALNMYKGVK